MKITEMIHATVLAFKPDRHPFYALAALAMFLMAVVAIAYLGGTGGAAALKAFL